MAYIYEVTFYPQKDTKIPHHFRSVMLDKRNDIWNKQNATRLTKRWCGGKQPFVTFIKVFYGSLTENREFVCMYAKTNDSERWQQVSEGFTVGITKLGTGERKVFAPK